MGSAAQVRGAKVSFRRPGRVRTQRSLSQGTGHVGVDLALTWGPLTPLGMGPAHDSCHSQSSGHSWLLAKGRPRDPQALNPDSRFRLQP